MARGRWRFRIGGGQRGGGETTPAGRFTGRIVATLFCVIFLAAGCLFVGLIAREAWRAGETFAWQEQRCEILSSQVARGGGEEPYRPEVAYQTLAARETVSGTRIQRRELSFRSHGGAAARLAPYPVGATVACYVSPDREAVLERGPLWIALWLPLPLVFVAIGGIGIFATWSSEKKDRFGNPVQPTLGDRAPRSRSGRALTGFGAGFAVLGGVLFWFVGVVPFAQVIDAQGWTRATCTVEHSSVVSHESDEGTTYSIDILYRWERGRGIERSSRYGFFKGSTSGRVAKSEVVRAHPVGADVPCWVDPQRRDEAVLERGLTFTAFMALVPLAFLLAGGAMLVAGRRRRARRARMERQSATGQSPILPDDPVLEVLPAFEVRPGPSELPSQSSRWGRLLGVTGAAIFWNGIVGLFLSEASKGWDRGDPDWFLTLFLVPFVLVGIGFCVGILHALLALANPRPRLIVSTGTPTLGDRVEIQWRFTGRTSRLLRVRIALKGKEQATYQVGTDTRTATEDFFEALAVDVPAPTCALRGHTQVKIPAGSMHSFESAHNEIRWEIELHGEIARWPDVKETYPLVVLPRTGGDRKPEER